VPPPGVRSRPCVGAAEKISTFVTDLIEIEPGMGRTVTTFFWPLQIAGSATRSREAVVGLAVTGLLASQHAMSSPRSIAET